MNKTDSPLLSNIFEWAQPQLISLIYTFVLITTLTFIVYFKVKKQKVDKAPKGIVFFAEQYVGVFNTEFKSLSGGNIDRMGPYIFALFTFLIVANTTPLIGLDPPTTSLSVPLMLGLISWMGIYVFGIIHQRLAFFKRFYNPMELISQFAPLISISFRIYGNILGGSILMFLIYTVTGIVWSYIPIIGEINFLGMIVAPWFHIYFDLFEAGIQAYVFTLLTTIYWSSEVEAGNDIKKKKNNVRKKQNKKLVIL